MNIFIRWQVVNYLQGRTLSTRYNYLLVFIYKLQFISNVIYKLSAIICKGYNISYKQGPTTTLNSYKYQVPLNPIHDHSPTLTHEQQACASLSLSRSIKPYFSIYLFYLLTHILTWASESFVLPQSRCVKSWSPLRSRLPWRALAPNFGKNS